MKERGTTSRNRKGAAVLVIIAALAVMSGCGPKVQDRPGAFTYKGLAIDPEAVSGLYKSADGYLDLRNFTTGLTAQEWESQPGWLITWLVQDYSKGRKPYFAYAAFSDLDPSSVGNADRIELYVLSIKADDGASGETSNLMLVEKQGSMLIRRKVWHEGLGCSGGIGGETMNGEVFSYYRQLTPYMFIGLAKAGGTDLVPNEDLNDGAGDCVAAADYVYNMADDREDMVSVRLNDDPLEGTPPSSCRLQACFDQVYNTYVKNGRTALRQADVEEFANAFIKACPARPAPAASDTGN